MEEQAPTVCRPYSGVPTSPPARPRCPPLRTALSNLIGFVLLVAVGFAAACSSSSEVRTITTLDGGASPSSSSRTDRASYLRLEGCSSEFESFRGGMIGVFKPDGTMERFDCNGVAGRRIKRALAAFAEQEALFRGGASAIGGYWIRHYTHAIRYCGTTTYTLLLGGRVLSIETVWDEGSCYWKLYYWDEWVPVDDSDEMPVGPSGGDGYFSPEDSLHREPTIDTTTKKEHKTCEGLSPHPVLGSVVNLNYLKPLTSRDSAWVFDSVNAFFRDTALISDTLDRRMCWEMRLWLDSARVAHWDRLEESDGLLGIFYRGANNMHAPGKDPHFAQSDGQRITGEPIRNRVHFDPRTLDSLLPLPEGGSRLAVTLLHEILHIAGGKDHPDIIVNPPAGYVGVPYFETLEYRQACTT